MTKTSRRSLGLLSVAVALVYAATTSAGQPVAERRTSYPTLRLAAGPAEVRLQRAPGAWVRLDLGTRVVAENGPWEVRLHRTAYTGPVLARQVVRDGGREHRAALPQDLVSRFSGLPAFTTVRVVNGSGTTLLEQEQDFCPNGAIAQVSAGAPAASQYPRGCPTNPFTLGAVWGIPVGWAAPSLDPLFDQPVDLPDGSYTAVVAVNPAYLALFGRDTEVSVTVPFTVATVPAAANANAPATADHDRHRTPPAANRPTGAATVTARHPRPDLEALPAWGIRLVSNRDGEYLAFHATVWNKGTAPLVVDGYRRPGGTDLMDAYQRFFDSSGREVGWAPAGTFEWDPRKGHQHWHFTDFAQYRLLDASGQVLIRSQKEAFCLANTDAVDYTLPGANRRPDSTGLESSCGGRTTVALRQREDIGSGDTYTQDLPGQSFTITDLPNGTYQIEIVANPNQRLRELTLANNTARRQITIDGTPGARTVHVTPYQGIRA
jgi:hypothetical protein